VRLREQLGLQYDDLSAGTLKVFRDSYAFERSAALAASLAPSGLQYRVLSAPEAVEMEPLLASAAAGLAGAIHYPLDASGDAHAYTRALEEHARRAGVRFMTGTAVQRLELRGSRIAAAVTPEGPVEADSFVLAAGTASPGLAAPLGIKLPMYPVKGYSVTLPARRGLSVPLVDFEQKIVLTPLGDRLRIAGTAEFNGFDRSLNPRRGANMLKNALALVPEMAEESGEIQAEYWTGLRPMTADGPPILGATPYGNLFLNTGHGPLGWTLGAGSGRVVADLVTGRVPEIDLAGLDYARYRH
ncbi:MAG: FAD-dependent oxidoreductase, partial [Gammaproteobacteria bacterium]